MYNTTRSKYGQIVYMEIYTIIKAIKHRGGRKVTVRITYAMIDNYVISFLEDAANRSRFRM